MTPRIAALILAGVIGGGCSERNAFQQVRGKFPCADIVEIPGHSREWIVMESNCVWYVTSDGLFPGDRIDEPIALRLNKREIR